LLLGRTQSIILTGVIRFAIALDNYDQRKSGHHGGLWRH
jgi:hypothetical protein